MLSQKQYNIIQFHAAISLIGYWFIQAIFQFAVGSAPQSVSIGYDGFQLILSLYVIRLCQTDFYIESSSPILKSYSIIMILYAFRIVLDICGGPFTGIVSSSEMIMNFVMTVLHTFTGVWAMISSRRYLNVESIIRWVYVIGIVTVVLIIVTMQSRGLGDSYKEDRIEGMGGLHSLSLAKLGTIEVLASIHVLLNSAGLNKWKKLIYLSSIVLASWLTLASGARGALVGLIIALLIFWLRSSLKNSFIAIVAILTTALFLVNIVEVFVWLSDYFPVIGNRMLETILENEQSNREILRERAYKLILDNPLFGYSYRLNADSTGYTCHNGVLDIALALGIPVAIWFVFTCIYRNIAVIYFLAKDKLYFFPATLLVANLTSAMSGSAIDSNSFGFAIVLSASLYYYRNSNEQINI